MTRLFWITFGLLTLGGVGWKLTDSIASSTLPALILKDPESFTFSHASSQSNEAPTVLASASDLPNPQSELEKSCTSIAHQLSLSLTAECRILVRPPYVIAGDLDAKELKRQYQKVILPVEHALFSSYFERRSSQPITILLFSNDTLYQHYAQVLDDRWATNYYGYYNRTERRILLNIKTGSGTLVHELTHAHSQNDFQTMPQWFDEGLAALHEESDFNNTGELLIGHSNWRLSHLQNGIKRNKLQPLQTLMTSKQLRSNHLEIDYAHARYFCLFLQHHNLLIPFYKRFRAHQIDDTHGLDSLLQVTNQKTIEAVDAKFLAWIKQLSE